jgi:hypothetical protein
MADKNKEPVSLATMAGIGEEFVDSYTGKKYKIIPFTLVQWAEFRNDMISIGPQIINLDGGEREAKLDKWIKACVRDSNGKELSLEDLKQDGINLVTLRKLLEKIADLSG